jgi:hypothetical protein
MTVTLRQIRAPTLQAATFRDAMRRVDNGERIFEAEGSSGELAPTSALIALGALDACASGKTIGDMLIARVEDVHAEVTFPPKDGPRGCFAIDADKHGRRGHRERVRGGDGESGSRLARPGGYHADAANDPTHRVSEGRRLEGPGRDLSKGHCHWAAALARPAVRWLADTVTRPIQDRLDKWPTSRRGCAPRPSDPASLSSSSNAKKRRGTFSMSRMGPPPFPVADQLEEAGPAPRRLEHSQQARPFPDARFGSTKGEQQKVRAATAIAHF